MTEWSIAGKGLKLTTEADAEPYVAELKQAAAGGSKLEKIVLSGNTLGIGACQAFAAVIKTISTLKVRPLIERPVVVFSLLKQNLCLAGRRLQRHLYRQAYLRDPNCHLCSMRRADWLA